LEERQAVLEKDLDVLQSRIREVARQDRERPPPRASLPGPRNAQSLHDEVLLDERDVVRSELGASTR
jgi:hypothetical protein